MIYLQVSLFILSFSLSFPFSPFFIQAAEARPHSASKGLVKTQTRGCETGNVIAIQGHADHESVVQSRVEALKAGSCVEDGMSILTREKSTVRFHLSSPAEVSVAPSSELLVGFPIGGKPTKLILTRGEIKVDSESSSGSTSPRLTVLKVAVSVQEKGTVFLSEVYRDGQEAWLVVLRGAVNIQLGQDPKTIILKAGQSSYFTDEQKKLPSVVSLDNHELTALEQDRKFKQTISQVVLVESGASSKVADGESEDLTLDQYVAQEKAQESGHGNTRMAPKLPTPPKSVNLPRVEILEKPLRSEPPVTQATIATHPVQQYPAVSETPRYSWEGGLRAELGGAFFNDAAGPDFSLSSISGNYGGGAGYVHASKADVNVSGVKAFGLYQYRLCLSPNFNLGPEIQAGLGFEQVTSQTKTYANGLAFYYSPRVNLNTNLGQEGKFHPGLTLGFQGFAGGVSTLSAVIELSLRFN